MASIDAFFELAERQPLPTSTQRLSLRRLESSTASDTDAAEKRQRRLILVAIGLVHVLLLLALSAAMRVQRFAPHAASLPMLITFIERPHAPEMSKPLTSARPLPAVRPVAAATRAAPPPRIVVRSADALQATITTPTPTPTHDELAPVLTYDATGALRIPQAETSPPSRDLLAHRSVSFMLPGGANGHGSHFQLKPDVSPQGVVNKYGGIISGLIGNVAARPDINGIILAGPDRGLRTSGRDTDPCEDIVLDANDTDPDHGKRREQADARYAASCEGH